MAVHSSILAWRIPGTEEPGGLLSMGVARVRHNLMTKPPPQDNVWSDPREEKATKYEYVCAVS